MKKEQIKVAVVQAKPALFSLQKGLEKIEEYLDGLKFESPDLVIFPEAYLPGYPWGLSFGTVIGNRSDEGRTQWLHYWKNAVEIPSNITQDLGQLAKKIRAFLVIGVVERDAISGTLYCSMLYFDPDGELLHKHRKLKPTAAERIIWGEGRGDDLKVLDSSVGRLGGLICWENYMPLARMALYEQGVELYVAPTADQRDTWQATMQHIACEGRCFVMGCNQYVTAKMFPAEYQAEAEAIRPVLSNGGSVIISPLGKIIAGPLWGESGVLQATLPMDEISRGKMDFDVVGHYARPDVFDFFYKKN